MTLQKVAKLAGVSVSTASKALSDGNDVSEETRALVKAAAEELGYFAGVKKRRLENRSLKTPLVGIICPEIISIHYSETVTALFRKIYERGGKASIFITEFDSEKQKNILERCVTEKEIDAVISLDKCYDISLREYPIPLVYLINTDSGSCVYSDTYGGIEKAAAHLFALGHTKIGFVGEPLTLIKEKYFRTAISKLSGTEADESLIFCENGRFETIGNLAAEKIAGLSPQFRPTAVIAAYDEVAYGLMYTLNRHGIHVPDDISVVGINDLPTSRFLDTPLTSVRNNTEKIADEALNTLFSMLSQKSGHNTQNTFTQVAVDCELSVRKSTSAPKPGI